MENFSSKPMQSLMGGKKTKLGSLYYGAFNIGVQKLSRLHRYVHLDIRGKYNFTVSYGYPLPHFFISLPTETGILMLLDATIHTRNTLIVWSVRTTYRQIVINTRTRSALIEPASPVRQRCASLLLQIDILGVTFLIHFVLG